MKNKNILLFIVCFMVLYGCGDSSERAKEYLESARSYYEQENYTKAKLEFKNALQIDDKLADAYYHLALIEDREKNWKIMYGYLVKTIQYEPDNYDARLMLSRLYLMVGQMEKANEEADFVLKHRVDDPDAMALKGAILLKQGDYSSALAETEKVLAINPGHIDAVNLQVIVYIAQEEYEIAEAKVNKALESKPEDMGLNFLKLQIHTKSNNIAAVEQDYKYLVKHFPSNFKISYEFAKFYASNQRSEDAIEIFQNLVDSHPDQITPKVAFVNFLLLNDKVKAEKLLNQYITEYPAEIELYFKRAELLVQNSQFEKAKETLNWIVEHKKKKEQELRAKLLLAKLAIQSGENSKASTIVKELLAVDEKHLPALLLKARINLINGSYDEAITDLRGILRDFSESDETMVLLAQAFLKKNSIELAGQNFRKALEINPSNFNAVMPVVSQMIKSKDVIRAEKVLVKALKYNPEHAGALQALAEVKLLRKDWLGTQEVADLIATHPKGMGFSKYLSGKISQGQNLYSDAIEKYEQALSDSPTLSDALKSMMVSYEALKQRDKMFVYLDEFMQKNPRDTYPLILKSQLYSIGNEWNKALAVLDKGVEQWPDAPQIYEEMARVYTKKNEQKKAKETYKKGLEKVPDNVRLRIYLASLYEAEKDYDNAKQHYEVLIDKRPDIDLAINNLVSLLLDHYPTKENLERAVDLSKRFEKSDKTYYLDTYGWALLHNGEFKQAIGIFKKLVRKNPDVAVFKYHLGLGYYKTNKNEKALKVLEQALEVGAKQKHFVEKEQVEALLEELKVNVESGENA